MLYNKVALAKRTTNDTKCIGAYTIKLVLKNNFSLEDALQFCSKSSSKEPENNSPRAALYAGKLGKNSKRAIKFQAENSRSGNFKSASEFARRSDKTSFINKISSVNIFLKVATLTFATILLVLVFCYQPAKICYTQIRDTEKSQTELALVQARNNELNSKVSALKTNEGIEDKAKDDYGYVIKGEGAAHVSGINTEDSLKLLEYVDTNKVTAPTSALTDFLDVVFDYDNSAK